MPDLGTLIAPETVPGSLHNLGFMMESSWVSIAQLATRLEHGAVHSSPRLADPAIEKMVGGVAGAAFSGKYRTSLAYANSRRWSDWFFGESEDSTWFWLDRTTGLATVLLITDGP